MRVVATAGHIDHGKSTLLRRLTGMEPDRWEEERRRGLTIDLGFVWTTLDTEGTPLTVAFVDVPGHERFVPNMLAGAGGVADALLVVAADDGWSVQTAEHVAILDLLGVRGVLVAVTKTGRVDAARVDAVCRETEVRLASTSLADAPVVPVDSLDGRGVEDVRRTLATRLAALAPPTGGEGARLWVDRTFSLAGTGTVVTGTVRDGDLTIDDAVWLAGAGTPTRIRGMQALGEAVEVAPVGTRVAVNLAGIPHGDLARGDALCTGPWTCTADVDVLLRSVAARELGSRGAWHLHVGSAKVGVRLRPLLGPIAPGTTAPARLLLDRPLPLRHGDRFVLRSTGERATVGGGRVLDPSPPRRPSGTSARLATDDLLARLANGSAADRVRAMVVLRGGVAAIAGLRADLGALPAPPLPGLRRLGDDTLVTVERHDAWTTAAVAAVRAAAEERGAPRPEVAAALAHAGCPASLRPAMLDALVATGVLAAFEDVLVPSEAATAHHRARDHRRRALLGVLSDDVFEEVDLAAVADDHGASATEVQRLLDDGTLVRVGHRVVTAVAVARARRRLQDAFDDRPFTAAEARDAWGTTRRLAVPLLEHLAATRTTTFDGTHHRLRVPATADRGPGEP